MKPIQNIELFSIRQLQSALDSPFCDIVSVLVSQDYASSNTFEKYKDIFASLGKKFRVTSVLHNPKNKKDRLQIHASVQLRTFSSCKAWLSACKTPSSLRLLILDQVQDPQNVGAMIRSAQFFAYDGVLMLKSNSAPLTSTVLQASSGALFTMPIIRAANLKREIDFLKKSHFFCLGLAVTAAKTLKQSNFTKENLALLMGNEGSGLRHLTEELCDELYKINDKPHFESLNVSVAAGIAMHHFEV